MMLYPSMASLLKRIDSRYMLVNVIAKRSRDISEEAERNDEHLDKKPVSIAIDELARGEYTAIPINHGEE
ncbi:MAG: DNA-directed RNA polymerase subunit omega [Oscillospiraceae bacterium]|jgi:DNA-directed RNA polymerase subunit omega|nr:DNA-directed RNA polymerase subunit omega [Oscillospiraceae bacterium]